MKKEDIIEQQDYKGMLGLGALVAGLYGYNKIGGTKGISNLYNRNIKDKTIGGMGSGIMSAGSNVVGKVKNSDMWQNLMQRFKSKSKPNETKLPEAPPATKTMPSIEAEKAEGRQQQIEAKQEQRKQKSEILAQQVKRQAEQKRLDNIAKQEAIEAKNAEEKARAVKERNNPNAPYKSLEKRGPVVPLPF